MVIKESSTKTIPTLPSGWRLVEICEIVKSIRNKGPVGVLPYIEIGDINVETKQYYYKDKPSISGCLIAKKDNILVSRVRPTRGAVSLVKEDNICVSSAFTILESSNKGLTLDKFIFDCLAFNNEFYSYLGAMEKGSSYPSCREKDIVRFKILLPPLGEQKRLTKIIDEQFSAIEKAKAATAAQLEAANALLVAHLKEIFNSQEIMACEHTTISDISKLIKDGPHITPFYVTEGIPFITIKNITGKYIDFTDVNYISERDHRVFSKNAKAEKGDILYTKDGTMGIPCVVDTDQEFSFFVSVALIKIKRELANPYYVAFALESPSVLEQVNMLGAGAGLKHMVLKSIRSLKIPLPSLKKQQEIVEVLRKVVNKTECIKKMLQDQLIAVTRLSNALLRQAFNGEL